MERARRRERERVKSSPAPSLSAPDEIGTELEKQQFSDSDHSREENAPKRHRACHVNPYRVENVRTSIPIPKTSTSNDLLSSCF